MEHWRLRRRRRRRRTTEEVVEVLAVIICVVASIWPTDGRLEVIEDLDVAVN